MDSAVLEWFSAKLRSVILVENKGALHYVDSVHIFRANDWSTALTRAIQLGRTHERIDTNEFGQQVRWAFAEVLTLDSLAGDELDGIEVNTEFSDVPGSVAFVFETQFAPETSSPAQTR